MSYYFQPDRLDETVPIVRGDTVAFDISSPSQLLTLTARLVREPGPPILEWTALEHEHRTTLVIDVPAGTYLLYVIGFWEHGGYQRAFKLEIVDESEGALSGAGVSGSVI